MTKAQPTAGPWDWEDDSELIIFQPTDAGSYVGIGILFRDGDVEWGGGDSPEDEQARANARLIAAAPDGLELAYMVKAHCCPCALKDKAEAIIAKVTGGDHYGP